jgi:hypothetical protein
MEISQGRYFEVSFWKAAEHNKVIIIDELLVQGSFNFSLNAKKHGENFNFIKDKPQVVDKYFAISAGIGIAPIPDLKPQQNPQTSPLRSF